MSTTEQKTVDVKGLRALFEKAKIDNLYWSDHIQPEIRIYANQGGNKVPVTGLAYKDGSGQAVCFHDLLASSVNALPALLDAYEELERVKAWHLAEDRVPEIGATVRLIQWHPPEHAYLSREEHAELLMEGAKYFWHNANWHRDVEVQPGDLWQNVVKPSSDVPAKPAKFQEKK